MKRKVFFATIIALLLTSLAFAGVIDFEDGADGQQIQSPVPGMTFSVTSNRQWIYGDWTTGKYQGPYPDGKYFSDGNFFAWLGTGQGEGIINFDANVYVTYFTVSYSAQHGLILEAYGDGGLLMDQQTGVANLDTGVTDFLTVQGEGIRWVKVKEDTGAGNYWLIDDIDTDAIALCIEDSECDDGLFCNGVETCTDGECLEATETPCGDDGQFCNGTESCDEEADICVHSGNPCLPSEECNEDKDFCSEIDTDDETPEPDETDEGEEDLWPKGTVTGGCCGCD